MSIALVEISSLVIIYILMIYSFGSDQIYTDLVIYRVFRVQDFTVYYGLLIAIVVIWCRLSSTLKAYSYQSYTEHRKRIFAQGCGMFLFCGLNLASEIMFVNRMMHLTV